MQVLSQAFLMVIAMFGFSQVEAEDAIVLSKKLTPDSELDIVIESETGDPDSRVKVSIFNMSSYKEVFRWFDNLYDAVVYIRDGHAGKALYTSYMRVCRTEGSFSLELQNYYAMLSDKSGLTKFLKVTAINTSDAVEQIKPQIIELMGYTFEEDGESVDVKIMSESEAQKFAGFIMQKS